MLHHNPMKNPNARLALALAALLAAGSAVAFDFDRASPVAAPFGGDALHGSFKALGKRLAAERQDRQPTDAFAGLPACAVVDAVTIRAYRLAEAVDVLQPCLKALSQRYAVEIAAAPGLVARPDGQALGLRLSVQGVTFIGNNVREDIAYAIDGLRRGRLLGFPASVETPFTAKGVSAAPAWVDAASLRIEPKQTVVSGVEGGLRVVLFDKDDNQVEFLLPPAPHADASFATVTFTKADDSEVGPLPLGSVALGRLVSGVAIPSQLDPRARAAVQGLFDALRSRW